MMLKSNKINKIKQTVIQKNKYFLKFITSIKQYPQKYCFIPDKFYEKILISGQAHKKYCIKRKNLESVVLAKDKGFGQAFFKKPVGVLHQPERSVDFGEIFHK